MGLGKNQQKAARSVTNDGSEVAVDRQDQKCGKQPVRCGNNYGQMDKKPQRQLESLPVLSTLDVDSETKPESFCKAGFHPGLSRWRRKKEEHGEELWFPRRMQRCFDECGFIHKHKR